MEEDEEDEEDEDEDEDDLSHRLILTCIPEPLSALTPAGSVSSKRGFGIKFAILLCLLATFLTTSL
jgi:hypothetical protein